MLFMSDKFVPRLRGVPFKVPPTCCTKSTERATTSCGGCRFLISDGAAAKARNLELIVQTRFV
jgi:hypothetical protein